MMQTNREPVHHVQELIAKKKNNLKIYSLNLKNLSQLSYFSLLVFLY